jgi:hypothetical protein
MTNNTIPLFSAIIGGLSGGFIFSFIRSWAWRKYTKPELTIGSSAATTFEKDEQDEISTRVFRVPIHNEGRSAAQNCKPELRMSGNLDGNEYEINTQLHWFEDQNPSRITINSGERAKYNLLKVQKKETDEYIPVDPNFVVQFAGVNGWDEENSITRWEYDENNDRATNVTILDSLERSTFQDISWHTAEVVITSGNTEKVESEIEINLEEEKKGMVGMSVSFKNGGKL